MPKTAILSDIHANLPALEAVLAEVKRSGAESIVFLGDIVGYGASPAECVALVRETGGVCVMGNHDEAIKKVRQRGCTFSSPDWKCDCYLAGLALAARSLDDDQAKWLASLPYRVKLPGAIAAHGSLNEQEAFHYIQDAETAKPTLEILQQAKSKVGFFGHTHVQGIFARDNDALEWLDGERVRIPAGMACAVTVGAVGKPHHDRECRAAWVLWDSDSGVVEFRKTVYNRMQAASDIAKAGLPMESSLELLTSEEISAVMER